ncbi:uncharacterized protein [Ptychodera flava]|uniref:uncharacterized protein n=1 Tax=Ptychodera flava TaxID=63121 RepID=UPI00396A462A
MDRKLLFFLFLTLLGLVLCRDRDGDRDRPDDDEEECPTFERQDETTLWFRRSFARCMRHAIRVLRENRDNCREVMNDVKRCANGDADRCRPPNHDGDRPMRRRRGRPGMMDGDREMMEQHRNMSVDEFIPSFCDGNFTMLPMFNKRNDSLPGCQAGYVDELDRCSSDFETAFKADPFAEGLCERSKEMNECQRGKLRDRCDRTFVSEDFLEEAEAEDQAGNFFCEAVTGDDESSADFIKLSVPACLLTGFVFIMRIM